MDDPYDPFGLKSSNQSAWIKAMNPGFFVRPAIALISTSKLREIPKIDDVEPEAFEEWGEQSEFLQKDFRKGNGIKLGKVDETAREVVFDEIDRVSEDITVNATAAPDFAVIIRRESEVTFTKRGEKPIKLRNELGQPFYVRRHYIWSESNEDHDGRITDSLFMRINDVVFPQVRFILLAYLFPNVSGASIEMEVTSPPGSNVNTEGGVGKMPDLAPYGDQLYPVDNGGQDANVGDPIIISHPTLGHLQIGNIEQPTGKNTLLQVLASGDYNVPGGGDPSPATPYPFESFEHKVTGIHLKGPTFTHPKGIAFNPRPGQHGNFILQATTIAASLGINTLGQDGAVLPDGSQWRVAVGPHFYAGPEPDGSGGQETWSTTAGDFLVLTHFASGQQSFHITFYMLWHPEEEQDGVGSYILAYIGIGALYKMFRDFYGLSGNIDTKVTLNYNTEEGAPRAQYEIHGGEDAIAEVFGGFPDIQDDDTQEVIWNKMKLNTGLIKRQNFDASSLQQVRYRVSDGTVEITSVP